MNWNIFGRKWLWPDRGTKSAFTWEMLGNQEHLNQYSQCSDRVSNRVPAETTSELPLREHVQYLTRA
jgi:hypothetical protein